MDRNEMLRLFDAGDWYGLMLRSVRQLLDREHPEVKWACVVGEIGVGIPALRITIPGAASASLPLAERPLPQPA